MTAALPEGLRDWALTAWRSASAIGSSSPTVA